MSSKTFKSMSGWLQLKASHKWTDYEFKTSGIYFHYFNKAKSSKATGELFKTQIKAVKPSDKLHKGAENCFEVHFSGPGSPWLLSAPSHESCIDWMECLQTGSSKLLKSSQKQSMILPTEGKLAHEELPLLVDDKLFTTNQHARSRSFPNARGPPNQQFRRAATIIGPQRQNPPDPKFAEQSSENYIRMSSAGLPATEDVCDVDDDGYIIPLQSMHSSSTDSQESSENSHVVCDIYDVYANPQGSVPSPPQHPPLKRQDSSSDRYMDAFRYFSAEQMRQFAEMMKGAADIKEGEEPQKQFSSPDLASVLSRTLQSIPDQILSAPEEMRKDDTSKKWARASSQPHGKSMDKLVAGLSDSLYQAFMIPKESLSDFKEIGKGQYGVVESALYRQSPGANPIKVAIKKTKDACSQLEKDNFIKEIVVMAQFMHPNIVRVFGSVEKGVTSPWLVLEYLSNGDLNTFLKQNSRPVHRLVKYMVDIAMGMHYLSDKGFVHRDLAARNIFMDESELCKVGDLGLLRQTTRREEDEDYFYVAQSELALPVRWMAVECLEKQIFSSASDVWSFGIVMWELFNPGVKPYPTANNLGVTVMVSAGKRLEIPEKCPKQVAQVMQACWNADYTQRPSFLVIANLLCRCIQHETPSSSSKT